jgi:kynurenine 3-monooxygenase
VSAFQTNVNVSFEFGKSLRHVDLESRLARFDVRGTESSESVAYDLLVGADGSESATRAALENEGALVCERNANGLYAKTVCLPPGFFEQTRASLFEKDGTGGPDPTPTPSVAESRAKELEKEKEKDDWRFRRHAWEHAGVVDAFAVPNAGKREGDSFELTVVAPLSRWKRVRTASDAETLLDEIAPGAFGCPDGAVAEAYKAKARDVVRDDATLIENGVSTTCSRLTRRDGSAVLVGDAAHSAWPTLGQNMDATLETSAYLGAALAKRARDDGPNGSRVAGVVRESRATDVPSEGGPSSDDTDGGKHDFDVKTALAAYFEKGRAPAARAFVRLCETGFGSGDVGFKRRFENVCFFAKLGALTLLHKLAPFLFDAPALTKMDDPSWGYDDVEDETRRETGVVFAVVACVVSLFCATRRFGARSVAESLGTVARAVLVGDAGGGEGLAVSALGFVAALTAAFRLAEKRRAEKRRARKGNATRRDEKSA